MTDPKANSYRVDTISSYVIGSPTRPSTISFHQIWYSCLCCEHNQLQQYFQSVQGFRFSTGQMSPFRLVIGARRCDHITLTPVLHQQISCMHWVTSTVQSRMPGAPVVVRSGTALALLADDNNPAAVYSDQLLTGHASFQTISATGASVLPVSVCGTVYLHLQHRTLVTNNSTCNWKHSVRELADQDALRLFCLFAP